MAAVASFGRKAPAARRERRTKRMPKRPEGSAFPHVGKEDCQTLWLREGFKPPRRHIALRSAPNRMPNTEIFYFSPPYYTMHI